VKLYTIGHSTATLPALIDRLQAAHIDVLVDVRSNPRSRMQHFDFGPLEAAVEHADISYRHVGDRLGGKPRDPEMSERWRPGKLDPFIIAHLRQTDEWTDGLAEIARRLRSGVSVCLMCSEADPDECHRKAIALDLTEIVTGLQIEHLAVRKPVPSDVGLQEAIS
jgi:uncharacterized protein (DUF488 family)